VDRRTVLTGAAGVAASSLALSSGVAAQEQPYGGWLSDVGNYTGETEDLTGNDAVTIEVGVQNNGGPWGFGPAAARIDPGTEVTFEWVSNAHNVLPEEIPDDSGWEGYENIENEGFTYSFTFETEGIFKYFCQPHRSQGMKAAIVVGDADVGEGGGSGGAGPPDWPGYVDDANVDTYEDLRGQDSVTVTVGAGSSQLAFDPTKVWIDPGTTVTWEWVGNLDHNVLPNSQPDGSDWSGHEPLEGGGFTYEFTFETGGVYTYFCTPHEAAGMKGAIAVGDDVPTVGGPGTGGQGGITLPGGSFGFLLLAVPFGALGIGAAALLAAEWVSTLRRTPAELKEYVGEATGTVRETAPALPGATEEIEHDDYDPWGTASLIFVYFVILVVMWIFVYFVEFLGGGPTVIG
jgi:halocyanin-like protein